MKNVRFVGRKAVHFEHWEIRGSAAWGLAVLCIKCLEANVVSRLICFIFSNGRVLWKQLCYPNWMKNNLYNERII